MRLKSLALVLASLAVSGCAQAAPPAVAMAPDTASEQGRAYAAQTCARCHGIGPGDDSRNAGAPRFVVIAGRYNEISLEDRLGQISKIGHYEMPPQQLGTEQIRNLTAYIQSLSQP
ncbi:c-type cytochrome [Phenylobacterium aquaticum]|uniref:c-type cytochrome n=1 Tax=Phenylobacterium aquaticum TaxID=1763816 RepID=UPI0026F2E9A4|nr:c-type cytochrome [Phenylobacterium aquaticum]